MLWPTIFTWRHNSKFGEKVLCHSRSEWFWRQNDVLLQLDHVSETTYLPVCETRTVEHEDFFWHSYLLTCLLWWSHRKWTVMATLLCFSRSSKLFAGFSRYSKLASRDKLPLNLSFRCTNCCKLRNTRTYTINKVNTPTRSRLGPIKHLTRTHVLSVTRHFGPRTLRGKTAQFELPQKPMKLDKTDWN